MPKGVKYGGRKKGTPNNVLPSIREAQQEFLVNIITKFDDPTYISPVEYMVDIVNDPDEPTAIRLDAANKAAPYIHQKLPATVEHSGKDGQPIEIAYAGARVTLDRFLLIEGEADEILEDCSDTVENVLIES